MNESINDLLENESLKKEFDLRNLDLARVFCFTPHNLPLENSQLKYLLDWVRKYSECKSRKLMEAEGYKYPPIDPCISPDEDWYIFERWVNGLPTRVKLEDQLPQNYVKKKPEDLGDDEFETEFRIFTEALEKSGYSISLCKDIPGRLVYSYLLELIDQELDMSIEGGWVIDGCSGYCPDCFQRPWCETGGKSCWTEDEEAGKMYLINLVKEFVSASPVSLQILKDSEAEEKKGIENAILEMNNNNLPIDHEPFNTDDDDDIPY